MPSGLVTRPDPEPVCVSMLRLRLRLRAKVAVTVLAALRETSHVSVPLPVPLQAPLQPVKRDPAAAAAVSVTLVPSSNAWLQVAPHAMPSGALVTVPVPLPVLATVSVFGPAAEELVTEPVSSIATHKVVD